MGGWGDRHVTMETPWKVEMDQVQRAAEPGGPGKGGTKVCSLLEPAAMKRQEIQPGRNLGRLI